MFENVTVETNKKALKVNIFLNMLIISLLLFV